jgi:hypothetical protein
LFVGLDYRGTTKQGLSEALELFDEVFVIHDVEGRTFHPKLYFVRGRTHGQLLVGSNNLTAGGTNFNYELAITHALDLHRRDDARLWASVDRYVALLKDDTAICKQLTKRLLTRLIRERWLGDEESSRFGAKEDAVRAGQSTRSKGTPIFTRSGVHKRTGPVSSVSRTRHKTSRAKAAYTPGPDSWWKKLNDTDVQRPRAGQAVGSVRMTRPSGLRIDPSTFFRYELFADEQWKRRTDREGNRIQVASVEFDAYLERRSLGIKHLRLDYAPHRAQKRRSTTLLHWDELSGLVHRRNLKNWFLLLEKGSGGVHRLTLTTREPS